MERILKRILLCVMIQVITCPRTGAIIQPSENFAKSVSLVKDDIYHLFWTSDDTFITFEVHAKVKGWVGFGLSPNGGMAKSDIVIGWVKDGVAYFKDCYAERQGIMPTIDKSQDWKLLAAEETSTYTVLKFQRLLYSCDLEDRNVTADTTRVIFAYSDMDPSAENLIMYHHSNRGTKSLLLRTKQDKMPTMPANAFFKDILNNNLTIPHDRHTAYWCQGFNGPDITEKHHLIKIEPIMQPGNEAFVHHIVVYACYHRPGDIEQVDESQGVFCPAHNMPWGECQDIITGWAVGGTPYNFPEHVGLPFGGSGGILFLRTETHYDNPQYIKGVTDSSGLRLWFTKSLRQYDAAILETGVIITPVGHILPAGYPDLTYHGHCTKECLSEGMGDVPEIHVFSILLHTHLLGTGIRVHHYRDGVEKAYLGSDLSYDFNYQETRFITPEITIRKGDNILVECVYNTKNKENATFGGFGTPEEMCLSYMYYYPRISLQTCTSVPTQANIAEHLSIEYEGGHSYKPAKITEGTYSGKTINEFIKAIRKLPDRASMDKFQEALKTGEIVQKCRLTSNTTLLPTHVPRVVSPYQEKSGQCYSPSIPPEPSSGTFTNQPVGGRMVTILFSCGLVMLAAVLTTN